MAAFVARRLLQAVPTVIGVTVLAFVVLHLRGDPAAVMLPVEATDADRAEFRRFYGLDDALPVQYGRFLITLLQGDLGKSIRYKEPAARVIVKRLPATMQLAFTSMLFALVIGVSLGVIAAIRHRSFTDQGVMVLAVLGQAIPHFWLGLMLMLVFGVYLRFLPPFGYGTPIHIVLPAVTLSTGLMALMARLVRSGMLEVLRQDYIRTAYAKGLQRRVVLSRHALKNALIPVVTVAGTSFASYMGGAIIVEAVFAWPGVGTAIFDAIAWRDYPVVLAALVLFTSFVIGVNLVVDIVYGYLDPRIRLA